MDIGAKELILLLLLESPATVDKPGRLEVTNDSSSISNNFLKNGIMQCWFNFFEVFSFL